MLTVTAKTPITSQQSRSTVNKVHAMSSTRSKIRTRRKECKTRGKTLTLTRRRFATTTSEWFWRATTPLYKVVTNMNAGKDMRCPAHSHKPTMDSIPGRMRFGYPHKNASICGRGNALLHARLIFLIVEWM